VRRRLLLAVLPLVLVATACGGGDTLSLDPVAQAAEKTTAQETSRFELDMRMTVPGDSREVELRADGVLDYRNQRGRMTVDVSSMADEPGLPLKMTMLFAYPAVYVQLPEELRNQARSGADKPWLKVDVTKAEELDLEQLSQYQNPADQLEILRAVSDSFDETGTEDVRGVRTTRFRAVVDLNEAIDEDLAKVPAEDRETAKRELERMADELGMEELPMDVWLDDAGVLRRMQLELEVPLPDGGPMHTKLTMDLFGFGTKVKVTPPPASQVEDVTELASEAASDDS
jgi:hypothetical protein